jgi:Phage tail assembly chaperone protein
MSSTNYVVYNQVGKITRILVIPSEDIEANLAPDEKYIEGVADMTFNYVDNNSIVEMPVKPSGEYVFNYTIKQWEFDAITADFKAKQQRDRLLADGPDRISPMWWSSMTPEEQQAWADYRQALLDITEQPNYPQEIVWPTKP